MAVWVCVDMLAKTPDCNDLKLGKVVVLITVSKPIDFQDQG